MLSIKFKQKQRAPCSKRKTVALAVPFLSQLNMIRDRNLILFLDLFWSKKTSIRSYKTHICKLLLPDETFSKKRKCSMKY